MLKDAIRGFLRPPPLWLPISLSAPQSLVRVALSAGTETIDVSNNHLVASLDPLTVAIENSLLNSIGNRIGKHKLLFEDKASGAQIAALALQPVGQLEFSEASVAVYEIKKSTHRCMSPPRRLWARYRHSLPSRGSPNPHNFSVHPSAIQQLQVLYICPRPVVLVSVDDGVNSNIFPMDLIGSISSDLFALALRNTSPSVATLRRARSAALAELKSCDVEIAYQLGRHHRMPTIDTSLLPFESRNSGRFGLPIPENALTIKEIEIAGWKEIGSHTFFLAQIVHRETIDRGSSFFHTSGIHREFRLRRKRPIPWEDPRTRMHAD